PRRRGARRPDPPPLPDAALRDPGAGGVPPLLPADRTPAPPPGRELWPPRDAAALAGGGVVRRPVRPLDRLPQDSSGADRRVRMTRPPSRRRRRPAMKVILMTDVPA